MTFFDKNPTGRIINRVSEDLLEVDQYLPYVMQYMIQELSCSFWYKLHFSFSNLTIYFNILTNNSIL